MSCETRRRWVGATGTATADVQSVADRAGCSFKVVDVQSALKQLIIAFEDGRRCEISAGEAKLLGCLGRARQPVAIAEAAAVTPDVRVPEPVARPAPPTAALRARSPGPRRPAPPSHSFPMVTLTHLRTFLSTALRSRAEPANDARRAGLVPARTELLSVPQAEVDLPSGERLARVLHPHDGFVAETEVDLERAERREYLLLAPPATFYPQPYVDRRRADVTLSITYNGREDAFMRSMASLLTRMRPDDLATIVDWVIVADGGASIEQRLRAQAAFPWATFVGKGAALHRHPVSLNLLVGSLIRTRWWLQWEDDWEMPEGGPSDLVARAREVAESGYHQVAVNGSWADMHESSGRVARRKTAAGRSFLEVVLPEEERARFCDVHNTPLKKLADAYLTGNVGGIHDLKLVSRLKEEAQPPLGWPLYSNQPSFNDTAFMRSLLPFSEAADHNPHHQHYWLFEFEFGCRFIRAGGRKATVLAPGLASQVRRVNGTSLGTSSRWGLAEGM